VKILEDKIVPAAIGVGTLECGAKMWWHQKILWLF